MRSHLSARVLITLLAGGLLSSCSGSKAAPPRTAAVPILAAAVEQKDVPLQVKAIGAVEAYSNVSVKTQVTGELIGVHFKEGQDVRKGQLLFTLDKRPFEAALKQAQGMLARDQAQAANARAQAKRYESLNQAGVVSREGYEQMQSNADALDAAVLADQAAVENARVQLVYCTIYSPIDGHTGPLLIHQGNMIKANDTPFLVSINQVQPIYATFTVPEQNLADIKRFSNQGKLRVQAFIPNDTRGPASGWLSFIDNTVDQATGTIKLKGEFVNADRRLWPGQFVDVVLTLAQQPKADCCAVAGHSEWTDRTIRFGNQARYDGRGTPGDTRSQQRRPGRDRKGTCSWRTGSDGRATEAGAGRHQGRAQAGDGSGPDAPTPPRTKGE